MDLKVAVLMSRQARAVSPKTWWIRAAHEAARWAAAQGWVLVSGEGLLPMDFVRWSFKYHGGTVETISIPEKTFRRKSEKANAFIERDRNVLRRADVLLAVSVRGGGIMEAEGFRALDSGRTVFVVKPPLALRETRGNLSLIRRGAHELTFGGVSDSSAATRDSKNKSASMSFLSVTRSGQLRSRPAVERRRYLWHFTRSCPGPWPGQTRDEYFQDLAERRPGAAHDGIDALNRILSERKIRGSGKIIRGEYSVVCLTEEFPEKLLSRRSFRSTLGRWDFEPYAVGIRRKVAEEAGIRPVAYLPAGEFSKLAASDRPFFQRAEPGSRDWTHEKEWRIVGDVDLDRFEKSDLAILVPAGERALIRL